MQNTLDRAHADWISRRGLDVDLARKLGLFTKTDGGGRHWLSIPYVEQGQVRNHKHRLTSEKKHLMDRGAPLILWNHDVLLEDSVQAGQQAVIITEGEWDAIAAIQSGFLQTVSVPNGAPEEETAVTDPENDAERYRFIWRSRAILDNVGTFILAVDDDPAGRALRADLARRLGPERCRFITYPPGCKDLNEVLLTLGEAGVATTLNAARPYPVKGIYRFSDYPEPPPMTAISLCLPACDDCYKLVPATLTIWTGFAGAGKTSLLMFLIANLLKAGVNIAMGSFETAIKPILYTKLIEALCGAWIEKITPERKAWAEDILQQRFTIVAQDSDDPNHELTLEETLELARISVIRDGVRLFIVDPWNEIEHKRRPDESEGEYTGRAIRAWKAFGKTYHCAVWIVAHPRKPAEFAKTGSAPGLYDVSGSAHWANKADYGIIVHRPNKASTIVEMTICKVRMGHPGKERTIKLDWQWSRASYVDGGNDDE